MTSKGGQYGCLLKEQPHKTRIKMKTNVDEWGWEKEFHKKDFLWVKGFTSVLHTSVYYLSLTK